MVRVFNFRSVYLHAAHLCCYQSKLPSLKLKTWPKQLLDYLPLYLAIPTLSKCEEGVKLLDAPLRHSKYQAWLKKYIMVDTLDVSKNLCCYICFKILAVCCVLIDLTNYGRNKCYSTGPKSGYYHLYNYHLLLKSLLYYRLLLRPNIIKLFCNLGMLVKILSVCSWQVFSA